MILSPFRKDSKIRGGIPVEMVYQKRLNVPAMLVIHHSMGWDCEDQNRENVLEYLDEIAREQWMSWAGHNDTYHEGLYGKSTCINYHFVVWKYKDNYKITHTVKYPQSEILWHAGDKIINEKSFGLVFMGDYSDKKIDDKALKLVANYFRLYSRFLKASIGICLDIKGHRDFIENSTDKNCPGLIYHQLNIMKEELRC